ncbi:MAG TPA: type II secretion system protein [Candidatus Saccharibacteria bacterium]|nr:type II secretion system protein [Candidatus Saccharibacteria bacterium]
MLARSTRQRGDTLVEVLFAISVFSLVVVGALSLMNQGSAAANRALDITLVRQQIDAQAEVLRYMHDEYVAVYHANLSFNVNDTQTSPAEEWYKMLDHIKTLNVQQASSLSVGSVCPYPPDGNLPTGSFIINPRTTGFVSDSSFFYPASSYPQVKARDDLTLDRAEGMWIEAIRSADSADPAQANIGFIDFHIRACWDSPGLPVPMTLGTIVRLYEPRG